jgi:Tol biopolymer transport system component
LLVIIALSGCVDSIVGNTAKSIERSKTESQKVKGISWHENVNVISVLPQLLPALPAWSPNGKAIAFIGEDGDIKITRAPEFSPRTIYTNSNLQGSLWSPSIVWQPDGSDIFFVTKGKREVEGHTIYLDTLASIKPDGSGYRDLLPGWKATFNGPSFAKGLVGWLDGNTLAFQARCGTECEVLYGVDVRNGRLVDLHASGPTFNVIPGQEWIVAQHGPTGGYELTLVSRQTATAVNDPDYWQLNKREPNVKTLTPKIPSQTYFTDWSPDGKGLLITSWTEIALPLALPPTSLYVWNIIDSSWGVVAPRAI